MEPAAALATPTGARRMRARRGRNSGAGRAPVGALPRHGPIFERSPPWRPRRAARPGRNRCRTSFMRCDRLERTPSAAPCGGLLPWRRLAPGGPRNRGESSKTVCRAPVTVKTSWSERRRRHRRGPSHARFHKVTLRNLADCDDCPDVPSPGAVDAQPRSVLDESRHSSAADCQRCRTRQREIARDLYLVFLARPLLDPLHASRSLPT
jgi:hypothetical protein